VHDRPTDVPAAYNDQHRASPNRLHEHLHLTSTYPGVTPFQVAEGIAQLTRLAIPQGLQASLDDSMLQIAPADGSFAPAARKHEHLGPFMPGDRSLGPNYGCDCKRLTRRF